MTTHLPIPIKDVEKIMECPICLEVPFDTPILQCATGHSFCTPCRQKLINCSLCQKEFTNSRNYALENMIQAAQFSCKFRDQGCNRIYGAAEMKQHQKECKFRPILCNDMRNLPCVNHPIDVANWVEHLRTQHGLYRTYYRERGIFNFRDQCYLLQTPLRVVCWMRISGKDILVNRITENNAVRWWISFVGDVEEAKKYIATITFNAMAENEGLARIDFTVPVHFFRDSFETVKGTGGLAVLPKGDLIRYCSQHVYQPPGWATTMILYDWSIQCRITKKQEVGLGLKRKFMT